MNELIVPIEQFGPLGSLPWHTQQRFALASAMNGVQFPRALARESFASRMYIAEEIADDQDERSADRLAALKLLSDTGGVDKIALTLDEQPERELTPERIASLWEQLEQIKDIKEFERRLVAAATKQIEGVGE